MSEDIFKGVSSGMDLGDSPAPSLPGIRKVTPKFNRPGITIRRDVKREWHEIDAGLIAVGDTVAEHGQIAHKRVDIVNPNQIVIENVLGSVFYLRLDTKVLAFIRVD